MSVAANRSENRSPYAANAGPWFAIFAGWIIGGLLALVLAGGDGAGDKATAFAIGAILGFLIALFAVGEWAGSRPFQLRRDVPLPPHVIQTHAARWFGGPPWSLARQQPGELVYWRRLEPNIVTALLLFLIGIIPGVLYVLATRGTQTVTIGIVPTSSGSNLAMLVQPQGHNGRRAVIRFFNSLHDL